MKKKHSGNGMRVAIAILAAAILACAGVLLGFHLGVQTALREAASTDSASVRDSDTGSTVPTTPQTDEGAQAETVPESAATSSLSASEVISTSSGESGSEGTSVSDEIGSSGQESGEGGVPSGETVSETVTPAPLGKIVCIDPGHQDHGMPETEPNGPGSSTMKAKLTSGTAGSASGKDEYEVNLEISLRLRDELEKRGYTVVMTRETNAVEISNSERAQIANNAGADIFIRIHCNSSEDSSVRGALAYVPTAGNPYLSPDVIERSRRLGQILVDSQCAVTGQQSRGLLEGDDMTGINWAQMPVTIIEMGFMSNPDEDRFLASEEGQNLITIGLANGVDAYFA